MLRELGRASRRAFFKTAGALRLGTMARGAGAQAGSPEGSGQRPAVAEAASLRKRFADIYVGSRRQLLFDDFFVRTGFWTETDNHPERVPHNIRWSLGRVERSEQPVMRPDQPREDWAGSPF